MKRWSNAAVSFMITRTRTDDQFSTGPLLRSTYKAVHSFPIKLEDVEGIGGRIIPKFMNVALIQANMSIAYVLHYTYQKMTKERNYCDPNFKHCLSYLRGVPVEPLRRIS